MQEAYEKKYHLIENEHWWFKARREIVLKLLKTTNAKSVIDIGCSSGQMLRLLKQDGLKAKGIDISKRAVEECKKNGFDAILANGKKTGLKEKFDFLIASDVLEHIENEGATVKEWNRLLMQGGKAIVFVPAFQSLWSSHDVANQHLRRYSLKKLELLFKKNGFKIKKSGYWNFFLFPVIAAVKFLHRKKEVKEDQLKKSGNLTNKLLLSVMKFENWLITKGIKFPFGVSCFVLVEK